MLILTLLCDLTMCINLERERESVFYSAWYVISGAILFIREQKVQVLEIDLLVVLSFEYNNNIQNYLSY